MSVIPFYGADDSEMFAIERSAMDKPGLVIDALNRQLPQEGLVLDVGAGDGFAASRLSTSERQIVAVEPADGMIDRAKRLRWVRGDAENLPFEDGSFDAAYATWAYFFTSAGWDPSPGLDELHRVVKPGGRLLVADNLGDDEFSAYVEDGQPHRADVNRWSAFGFDCEVIDTLFSFENLEEAGSLLGFFFGDLGRTRPKLEVGFSVGLFVGASGQPQHQLNT